MSNTPNHEYYVPAEGTTNWHIPINKNFENLDTDIAIRDAESNISNYEPKTGAKFEATDSGAIYYGDGSTWTLANRKVSTLTTTDVYTNNYTQKGQVILSYADTEGATIHEAYDDIHTAVSNVGKGPDNVGQITVIGRVYIDEPIAYQDDWYCFNLKGLQHRTSRILPSDSFTGRSLFEFSGSNIINFWGSIDNIQFDGRNMVDHGIMMDGAQNGLMHNITISNTNSYGLKLQGSSYDNIFYRLVTLQSTEGVYIGNANECTFYSCMFRSESEPGVTLIGPNLVGPRFYNCKFRNANPGLQWNHNNRNKNVIVQGCHFEGSGDGITICPAGSSAFQSGWIAANKFNGNTNGIKVANKVGNILIGPMNWFDGTDQPINLKHNAFSRYVFCLLNNIRYSGDIVYDTDKNNTQLFEPFIGSIIMDSNVKSDIFAGKGFAASPTDLSGSTGDYDGEMRVDNGENTSRRGISCVWDEVNSVWVRPDGTTFA